MEKRLAYLKKIAEMTTKHFIGSDNKLNVEGIILAGSANFKSDLASLFNVASDVDNSILL